MFSHRKRIYDGVAMAFPIKTCVACGEEFELRPGKPGFANRCPQCSEPEANGPGAGGSDVLKSDREAQAARRAAIKEMLYSRK
jgi:hypothetical protein